jgi:hypothetical protein
MATFWIIATFAFTFCVVALVVAGLVWLLSHRSTEHVTGGPTVDGGYRAF